MMAKEPVMPFSASPVFVCLFYEKRLRFIPKARIPFGSFHPPPPFDAPERDIVYLHAFGKRKIIFHLREIEKVELRLYRRSLDRVVGPRFHLEFGNIHLLYPRMNKGGSSGIPIGRDKGIIPCSVPWSSNAAIGADA
jgi:hypothetical protein